jgi:AcrR family transcriptional regulator
MAQKRKPDQRKLIMEAALSQADKVGWSQVTLKEVAKKARVPLDAVTGFFPDTWAILLHALKVIDDEVTKYACKDSEDSWRNNLFEVLMTRFELVQKHRPAFLSISAALTANPQVAPKFIKPYGDSMRGMLLLAKAPASPLHILVFGGLHLALIETWAKDETPDLSKTMSAIDKRLEWFERVSGYLACGLKKQ